MNISGKKVGIAITGSFCTFDKVFEQIEHLTQAKADVYTIFSECAQSTDTRFGKAENFLKRAEESTGHAPIRTITE